MVQGGMGGLHCGKEQPGHGGIGNWVLAASLDSTSPLDQAAAEVAQLASHQA